MKKGCRERFWGRGVQRGKSLANQCHPCVCVYMCVSGVCVSLCVCEGVYEVSL